ncbi:MAG: 2-hydroxy-3-oxopropionate reductase [Chloroflexota bacterium]|jgi:3-hydroxyisobutyrate dehydrogenase-like beta-hydroxyacid dehydrogenase|nr:2-hydroxy-3-oxopropionate reductase [Chloroflexota bacterium]
MSTTAPRIAILGTGKMGSAIAGRLDEDGFDLILWNRTRARAGALGLGRVAGSPRSAATDADVVISSLTGPEAVRAAYLGPNGALKAGPGKLFIEMSTAGPDLVSVLAADVVAAGGRLIDAPIVGAPTFMRDGNATILVGGDEDDVERGRRILGGMGTVRHVGPLGNGARLKLVANSMLADVILAATELQVAGERSGLDPDDVFWMLQRMAPLLAARHDGIVEDRHVPVLFALRDLRKDLDLSSALFAPAELRTPLTARARQLVVAATKRYGDLDITALERPYRELDPTLDGDRRQAGS